MVDDGVATGSTMLAAVAALRKLNAARVVVATPTIAASTCEQIQDKADEMVAVTPEEFYGVGQWYEHFSQTSDTEVRELLGHFGPGHHKLSPSPEFAAVGYRNALGGASRSLGAAVQVPCE